MGVSVISRGGGIPSLCTGGDLDPVANRVQVKCYHLATSSQNPRI